jgi:hypothetical protein
LSVSICPRALVVVRHEKEVGLSIEADQAPLSFKRPRPEHSV